MTSYKYIIQLIQFRLQIMTGFSQYEAYNISFWINQMHTCGAYVINYVILKYIIFYTKSNY